MGVQKPPVNIEWYSDGFSMKEQAELKREYQREKKANRLKLKVSEQYHEKTKDRIISELRQKLAADEEYIKELEESSGNIEQHPLVIELTRKLQSETAKREYLQQQYTNINNKYVEILNNPELGTQKYRDTIKNLELEIKELKKVRDTLIAKLCLQSKN